MGPILSGYGIGCSLIVVNCMLQVTLVTLNQLEQEQSVEAATHNFCCSQPSCNVSCGQRWHFLKPL